MRKIFIAALCGLLMNFLTVPAASAAEKIDSVAVKNSDVEFCVYKLFAQRRAVLRAQIDSLQLQIERLQSEIALLQLQLQKNPDDAATQNKLKTARHELAARRHELAEKWHELGRIYFAEGDYDNSLDAFNHAVELVYADSKDEQLSAPNEHVQNDKTD